MISTRNVAELPEPLALKKLTKALAMLDAIIEREWEYRYYSFNSKWSDGEEMASMRNGQGDSWYCVFGPPGVFLKGFDHESKMSPWNQESNRVWPNVIDKVPSVFASSVTEPAFSMKDTTFCIWRENGQKKWSVGDIAFPNENDPDGSAWMLSILDGDPMTYREFAEGYYERPVSLDAIKRVYEGVPLTASLVNELNPAIEIADLFGDAAEVGYLIA